MRNRSQAIDAARQRKAARILDTLRLLPAIDPATFGPAEWEIVRRKLGERTLSPVTQALVVAEWHRHPPAEIRPRAPRVAFPCWVCGGETARELDCSYHLDAESRFVRVHARCREAADRQQHSDWFGPCSVCGLDSRRFRLAEEDSSPWLCYEHYRQRRIAAEVEAKAQAEASWLLAARAGLQTRTVSDVTGTSTIAWGPGDLVSAWVAERKAWAESPTGRAYGASVREWTERGVAHASVSSAASCE